MAFGMMMLIYLLHSFGAEALVKANYGTQGRIRNILNTSLECLKSENLYQPFPHDCIVAAARLHDDVSYNGSMNYIEGRTHVDPRSPTAWAYKTCQIIIDSCADCDEDLAPTDIISVAEGLNSLLQQCICGSEGLCGGVAYIAGQPNLNVTVHGITGTQNAGQQNHGAISTDIAWSQQGCEAMVSEAMGIVPASPGVNTTNAASTNSSSESTNVTCAGAHHRGPANGACLT